MNEEKLVTGLFMDSDQAGEAVAELKQKGYTKDISFISRDFKDGEVKSHQVKEDITEGAATGAATGGVIGGLAGIAAGAVSLVVPGIGPLVIAGPLAAAWGLTGSALGALAGGLVGALVDAGIPKKEAERFKERIVAGDVLVAVTTDGEHVDEVSEILDQHDVLDSTTGHYVTM